MKYTYNSESLYISLFVCLFDFNKNAFYPTDRHQIIHTYSTFGNKSVAVEGSNQ